MAAQAFFYNAIFFTYALELRAAARKLMRAPRGRSFHQFTAWRPA
jgi:hypothetical protein